MKNTLITLLILCSTTLLLNAQEGKEIKRYWKGFNNVIAETGIILPNGKEHGKWKYYDFEGKIDKIVNWDNGIEHGKIIKFDSRTSEVEEITTYAFGKKDGVYEKYYKGNIEQKGFFKSGIPYGTWREYYDSDVDPKTFGKVEYEIKIEDGYTTEIKHFMYNTTFYDYDRKGFYTIFNYKKQVLEPYDLYGVMLMSEYNGKWQEFYEDGTLFREGEKIEGKNEGAWKYYYKNTKLWAQGKFENNRKIGEWKAYYDNNQVKSINNYIFADNGEWSSFGKQKSFYKSGKLKSEINYNLKKDLVPEYGSEYHYSTKIFYYENGNIEIEIKCTKEEQSSKYYYENGSLRSETYHLYNPNHDAYNIKTGIWKDYNEDGSLEKTETYVDGKLKE